MVSSGNAVLDVGCDHAYVPIYLVSQGKCPEAIASDIQQGPLGHAQQNVDSCHLGGRILVERCDGIPKHYREQFGDIPVTLVISGMGGLMIRSILEALPDGQGVFQGIRDGHAHEDHVFEDREAVVDREGDRGGVADAGEDGGGSADSCEPVQIVSLRAFEAILGAGTGKQRFTEIFC